MLIVEQKPLIFLDDPKIDELSVSSRCMYKEMLSAFGNANCKFKVLNDFIDPDSSITYGVVKAGESAIEGIPMIKVEDIKHDRTINTENLMLISSNVANQFKRTSVIEGDILISIVGTIGRVGFVPKELEGANIFRSVGLIRLADKNLKDLVALYLESDLALHQLGFSSRGGANKRINLEDLRVLKIPDISTRESDIIVKNYNIILKIVNSIYKKAENIASKIEVLFDHILESIASDLNLSKFPRPWFSRFYFQKAESEVDRIDVLGANPQFEDECWASGKFVPLSDACEVDGSNEQIPLGIQRYISIDSLPGNYWGDIDLPEMEIERQDTATHFYPGDIVWARLKPSILQSKAYIIKDEGWGSPEFLKINASKLSDDLRIIIWAYLKTGPIKRHLANKCTGMSESQKRVSDVMLGILPFPKLDDDKIKRVASAIRDTIEKTHELEAQGNAYKEKADDLLKKAKSNIFNLLDDDWFNALVSEAKEALQ